MRLSAASILCSAVALTIAGLAHAAETDFSGNYVMTGRGFGPEDSAYTGTCTITRAARSYDVSCRNNETRHSYRGEGMAIGNVLSIFIGDVLNGDHQSLFVGEYLVTYERQPDGRLVGQWVHAASEAAGAETLTPSPP